MRMASDLSFISDTNENDEERTFELLQNESLELIVPRIC